MTLPADNERYTYADVSTEVYSGMGNLARGNEWGISVGYGYSDAKVTLSVYKVIEGPEGVDIQHHFMDGMIFDRHSDGGKESDRLANMNDAYRAVYNAGLMFYMRRR